MIKERRNERTERARFWKNHPCEWRSCQNVDYSGRKASSEQGEAVVDEKPKINDCQEPWSLKKKAKKKLFERSNREQGCLGGIVG